MIVLYTETIGTVQRGPFASLEVHVINRFVLQRVALSCIVLHCCALSRIILNSFALSVHSLALSCTGFTMACEVSTPKKLFSGSVYDVGLSIWLGGKEQYRDDTLGLITELATVTAHN